MSTDTKNGNDILRLAELILLKLDNKISAEQMSLLNDILRCNELAREVYLDFISVCSGLSNHSTVSDLNMADDTKAGDSVEGFDFGFWQELAEEEKNAPTVEIEHEKPEKVYEPLVRKTAKPKQINKFSLYTAILSAAALLFIIVFVSVAPPASQEVASILDSVNAEWSSGMPIKEGIRLSSHSKPIQLSKGILKLVTDENVEVILEGPSEFRFISYSEIALNYGKLYAKVSDQGLGFSVSTPNSKVVDLGTEFGVLCQINGDTEVYMYKGKASLFAGQKSESKTSEILEAGSARKVDYKHCLSKEIKLDRNALVRNVDSKANMIWKGEAINLADIVGGGDGFEGGVLNRGLDVTTGNISESIQNESTVAGPKGYIAVDSNPYVDGVFVPGITGDTTQIASDGTLVSEIPATSGALWGYIFNGAIHKGDTTLEHSLTLNGEVMGTKDNPAITIHSNQGITFDLSKIRNNIPGLKVGSFNSLVGISETAHNSIKNEQGHVMEEGSDLNKVFERQYSTAEFWVFVDGRQAFHDKVTSDSIAKEISVPISKQDRFLTIAVTEADDTLGYDWAMFARPELVLESGK